MSVMLLCSVCDFSFLFFRNKRNPAPVRSVGVTFVRGFKDGVLPLQPSEFSPSTYGVSLLGSSRLVSKFLVAFA